VKATATTTATESTPTASSQPWPLTPIQRGFLAESLVSDDKGVNVEQVVGEFAEPLDEASFKRAWQHAVDSFDAFRLRLGWPDGAEPQQRVAGEAEVPFRVIEAPDRTPEAALDEFLARDRESGFNVYDAPLLRVSVLKFAGDKWAFVWTVHHTIIDGGAYATVLRFVFAAYDCFRRDQAPQAWDRPPYAAFLRWFGQHDSKEGVQYFRGLLAGFDESSELPYQASFRREPARKTRESSVLLSAEQTQALQHAAAEVGVTPNTVLQLAWGLLLARYSGKDDVVFGATWSGRPGTIEQAAEVVGPFINTLPVRLDLTRGPSVREALRGLREQHIALRPYQHTPLQEIKANSDLAAAAQLFETFVVFEYERFFSILAREDARFAQARLWSRSQTSYPLGVTAYFESGCLRVTLDYDTGLYDEKAARELTLTYARLLVNSCYGLDISVHRVHLLEPEVFRTLTQLELARELVSSEPSALDRVMQAAAERADAVAIQEIDGERSTYAELTQRVVELAGRLVVRGVRPGDIVGVLMPRSIDAVISMLAIHAAGAAFLPLDPTNPEQRLEYMVDDSKARVVLVSRHTPVELGVAKDLRLAIDAEERGSSAGGAISLPTDSTPASGLAYVIYTSGSTGQPKGVCIPHSALANHVAGTLELFALDYIDRVLQFAALSFDASIEEIFPTLAAGATLVIRNDEMVTSARNFFEAVTQAGITVLDLPTAFWHQLVHAELPWPEQVRLVVIGGERASAPTYALFRRQATSHIRFLNTYGPTETTVTSTVYDDAAGDHDAEDFPIGKPARGLSHFALDRHMRPVVPGTVGQLYIGGAGLAIGYLRRDELTRERFTRHPWRSGGRLYATGDLVRQTERGNYVYVDRIDNQVKIRGFRIELGEIEARLCTYPAVKEAVVVVQKEAGQDARLLGFAVADPDQTSAKELRDHLAAALPAYMVPAHLWVERELPKTPAGKVDRRALARRTVSVDQSDLESVTDDTLERELIKIWSELLKVPVTDTHTSFFELGGNSLVAVQMFTQVEKRLGKTCKVMEFFKNPTVAALRVLIDSHDGTDWKAPCLHLAEGKPGVLPIFLAPSVTGRAIDYVHLAEVLGEDFPVYALQIRGLREGEAPHPDLASAANFYADLMQQVQPKGPYVVFGFSAGGTIAMAIAEALHDRGEAMALVGALDTVPPVRAPSPFTSFTRLRRLARTTTGRVQELLSGPDALKRLWIRTASALMRGAAMWLPLPLSYHAKVEGLFVGAGVELSEAEKALMQSHLNAIMSHTPKRYPIDVVLLRTHLDPFEGPHEPDLGWSRAVTGNIVIDTLPCMHHELLTRDGAPRLAALVRPYLEKLPRRAG
jgi:amino acid adenylation domain-containing protein